MLSDEEIEELTRNTDIVRHGTKIASVRANALYILDIRAEHGSFGAFMADWPDSDFVGLWLHLKKYGSRLGGQTGRYCLRFLGYDTPILSPDVVTALIGAGVVDKEPTSKRDLLAMQEAFNTWREQSGRSAAKFHACSPFLSVESRATAGLDSRRGAGYSAKDEATEEEAE